MLHSTLENPAVGRPRRPGGTHALAGTQGPRVLVVGSAHLDVLSQYHEADAGVIDKPGMVVFAVGGSAFNVASNLACVDSSLGLGEPMLYTHLRAQGWSTPFVLEQIRKAGIDPRFVQQDPCMSYESAFVAQFRDAELETAVSSMGIEQCVLRMPALTEAFRAAAVAVADCNLSSAQLQKVFNLAEFCGVPLVIDATSQVKSRRLQEVSRHPQRKARVLVVLTEREAESAGLVGSSPQECCEVLRADTVVLTKAEAGWTCLGSDGSQQVVMAPEISDVRSSAGAGDAVVAAIAATLALDIALDDDAAYELIHRFTTDVLARSTASMSDSRLDSQSGRFRSLALLAGAGLAMLAARVLSQHLGFVLP